jgi:Mitochondrial carrier protein
MVTLYHQLGKCLSVVITFDATACWCYMDAPLRRRANIIPGVQGLWRGTLAGQLLYVPYTVVQFVTLQQVNLAARRMKLTDTRAAPLISYASGAVAGIAATCISYPFDLLRTTLAAQGEPKVSVVVLSKPCNS